jgi:hypothetical protein
MSVNAAYSRRSSARRHVAKLIGFLFNYHEVSFECSALASLCSRFRPLDSSCRNDVRCFRPATGVPPNSTSVKFLDAGLKLRFGSTITTASITTCQQAVFKI